MLLQRVRDEAHRFAITFHRVKRSKSTFKTELEEIPGIGAKTADTLLKQFKSVSKIRETSREQLIAAIGKTKAEQVLTYLGENKKGG